MDVASLNISENLLLDIGVVKFDAGVPEDNDADKTGIYEEIREAESRYFPYHIKTTLEKTGYWGSVRVIPSRAAITDIIISGTIIRSDGEYVSISIKAEDITGQEWFIKEYSTQTGLRSYSENRDRAIDPYQKVFNDFANDLRLFAASLHSSEE